MLVYEKNLAGEELKTYGAGVNIYVNDFALYNYLSEENDWLGFADYSQRKKATRLKWHNVFGYVNFPGFNENIETLQISNERADFIQDITYQKLMFILKGVVMFAIFNIDVADKNPKYKIQGNDDTSDSPSKVIIEPNENKKEKDANNKEHKYEKKSRVNTSDLIHETTKSERDDTSNYQPQTAYKPKPKLKKNLQFSDAEGKIIDEKRGKNKLGNKIYNLVYELSKLDLQEHRYAVACLYRSLIESATKYAMKDEETVYDRKDLAGFVICALNKLSQNSKSNPKISDEVIKACRDSVSKQKIIDILNEYVHNDTEPDAFKIQESWNTMKEYVYMCLLFK